ncbi:MAG: type II toxin-antitoxin system prevent-host-death family antitoxin [Acidimicrobiia bacterium]|nr:type II toxin-antitoxin system prevent-host-death family antitoxin [Acidimicrobiia bacterium]
MCYMDRVGIRELRQNLSVYVQRVKDGESLEVTEHGHTVAALVPVRDPDDPIERMRRDGRLKPAEAPWPPPPPLPATEPYSGTKGLMEDREGKE